jgi:preprotein translocase subunit SecB
MLETDAQRDAEVAEKAKPVSDRVQIIEIRMLESRAEQKRFDENLPRRMTQTIQIETHLDAERSRLEVFPHFMLVVKRHEGSPEEMFVRIEARFALTYSIGSQDNLSETNYEAFGQRNGVYNAWPYWREFVQSTTVRMGLPPLTLPVYRVGISKLQQDASLPEPKAVRQISVDTPQKES